MDVDGGNINSLTLMDLTNGETYTISIAGRSSTSTVLPSPPVSAGDVALGSQKPSNAVCMEPITHVLVCVSEYIIGLLL